MLYARPLLERDGLLVGDVACRHPRGHGREVEVAAVHRLVFVRRGCFVHHVDGVRTVLDPTVAYCVNPGVEQRFDHPHDAGDDCTAVTLDGELVRALWGGERALPAGRPLPVPPGLDLGHRTLLAAARRGAEPDALFEATLELVAGALEGADAERVWAGRPGSAAAQRAVVDGARELLAEDCGRSQRELARRLAVSPHHLSRIFRAHTGSSLSGHRVRLRVRAALERLHGGERDLARLAADVGFADQSHLCRAVRAETGETPGALRTLLG